MPRKYEKKIPNITHNGIVDVWEFCDFEEQPNEFGKNIYIDVSRLADACLHEIQSNKKYKNFNVELCGVDRWEW